MLYPCSLIPIVFASLALLGLSVSPANAAIYTYYHTGQTFDFAADGPYTSDMSVTAMVSFDLATNISLAQAERNADIVAFSVFDGVKSVNEYNGSFATAVIETNASGELTYWEMLLIADAGGFIGFRSWTVCYGYGGSDNATEACAAQGPGLFGSTPPAVVPIPAAAWLFGTALVGLVGFSKRRKAA